MKHTVKIIFILLISSVTKTIPPTIHEITPNNHYHLYLWGHYNQLEENSATAKKCYETLLMEDGSVYTYPGYLHHLFATGQFQKIVNLMTKIEQHFVDHLDVQVIFMKAMEAVGKQSESDKRAIYLHERFNNNVEIIYSCALAHIRNNQPAKAISIIDTYLENNIEKSINFIFYYLKAQIYLEQQNKDLASENIQKCLKLNPNFEQGWLLSGLIAELEGNINDAITRYKYFLNLVGHDPIIEQQIINLGLKQKTGPFSTISQPIEKAKKLYREKEYTEALKETSSFLNINRNNKDALLLKIELLCAQKKHDTALEELKQLIYNNPEEELWYRSLHLLYYTNIKKERIIQMLKDIEQQYPENTKPVLYLADIFFKEHDTKNAIFYLKRALILTPSQKIKEKVMYQLGSLYFSENNITDFRILIRDAERLNPSFEPLVNLMAYYYATKGHNPLRAQSLFNKLSINFQKNPHAQDTQAMIWYKQKQYNDAITLLSQAKERMPKDPYILRHLAKNYFRSKQYHLASSTIQQAKNIALTQTERDRCKKLQNRLKLYVA